MYHSSFERSGANGAAPGVLRIGFDRYIVVIVPTPLCLTQDNKTSKHSPGAPRRRLERHARSLASGFLSPGELRRSAVARGATVGSSPVGLCKLEKNWLENTKDEAYDNAVRRNTCDCGGPPWRASRTRFWRGDAAWRPSSTCGAFFERPTTTAAEHLVKHAPALDKTG